MNFHFSTMLGMTANSVIYASVKIKMYNLLKTNI